MQYHNYHANSNLFKNSQAVKQGCTPMQNGLGEKSCEIQVAAKK